MLKGADKIGFDDILTIVNFNHPHYNHIPFLKEIYGCFTNMIFYGDDEPECLHPEVIACKQDRGHFAYAAMLDALKKYPNYSGYLFVMDDMLLNYWNLEKRIKDRVWFQHLNFSNVIDVFNPDKKSWWWWNTEFGIEKCKRAWLELPNIYQNRLEKFFGIKNAFMGQCSDFYYVPRRVVKDFIEMLNVLSKHGVFYEIAIPTTLCAIEDYKNWERLSIKYLWGDNRPKWRNFYSINIDGLHPVKFSDTNNQDMVRRILKNR